MKKILQDIETKILREKANIKSLKEEIARLQEKNRCLESENRTLHLQAAEEKEKCREAHIERELVKEKVRGILSVIQKLEYDDNR